MQTFYQTDIGRRRNSNQDYLFCEDNQIGGFPNLFIIADGMGGHNAGDIASRIGVEQVLEQVRKSDKVTPVSIWEEALQKANQCVYQMSQKDENLLGMGTTFVGVTIFDKTAYIVNVGDSRLYLLRQSLMQITEDHSLVSEMVRSGEIRKDEMNTHPNKNIITRALGTKDHVKVDCFEIDLMEGDVILLCSDGLSNMLDDLKMEEIICENKGDIEVATHKLVENANDVGGRDNISVILIQV